MLDLDHIYPGYIITCDNEDEWIHAVYDMKSYIPNMSQTALEVYVGDFSACDSLRISYNADGSIAYGRGTLSWYKAQAEYAGYIYLKYSEITADNRYDVDIDNILSAMSALL